MLQALEQVRQSGSIKQITEVQLRRVQGLLLTLFFHRCWWRDIRIFTSLLVELHIVEGAPIAAALLAVVEFRTWC